MLIFTPIRRRIFQQAPAQVKKHSGVKPVGVMQLNPGIQTVAGIPPQRCLFERRISVAPEGPNNGMGR